MQCFVSTKKTFACVDVIVIGGTYLLRHVNILDVCRTVRGA